MSTGVFRKYPSREEAEELINLLEEYKIPYKLEDYTQSNNVFLGQAADLNVLVKAKIEDFPKIEELLDENTRVTKEEIPNDHYLLDFSNEELTEIILKPNEWSNFDYKVAELLLNERGVPVSKEFIVNIKKQRYNSPKEKNHVSGFWIFLGYFSAVLGGIIGCAIGLSLWMMTEKQPGGKKVYTFDERTRVHGKRISIIGMCMLTLAILVKIITVI